MGWSALKDGKVSSFHHRPVQERLETRQETRSESSRPFSSHWVVGKWWTIAWKQPWPQLAWWLWRLPWMPYFPRLATHLPKRYRNTNHNIISYWDPFRPFQQEKEITSPMFAPSKQWNLGLVFSGCEGRLSITDMRRYWNLGFFIDNWSVFREKVVT